MLHYSSQWSTSLYSGYWWGKGRASCVISIDLWELMLQAKCIYAASVMCVCVWMRACRRVFIGISCYVSGRMAHEKRSAGRLPACEWAWMSRAHNKDSDNKAVSFVQQVSSAVIISRAGHTHTHTQGQGHWQDWAQRREITCHTNSNHVSPQEHTLNFTARSITDQVMWLRSAPAVVLTDDCMSSESQHYPSLIQHLSHCSLIILNICEWGYDFRCSST